MRDLRSALSWMLLRDQSCQEVAQQEEDLSSSEQHLEWFYFNAFQGRDQASGQAEDRLVRLLRQIDPAGVANPATDRILFYKGPQGLPMLAFDNRSSLVRDMLNAWPLPTTWQAAQQPDKLQEHHWRHAYLRRLAFFERRDVGWEQMLPYRHLDDFKQATQEQAQQPAALMNRVASGFSFVEGARNPELVEGFVCIRAGQNMKTRVRSFRLFPLADFTIQIPPFQANRYLEYTNHHFTFVHTPTDGGQVVAGTQRAALTVSLDLLELLEEINEGYIPSPDDISGIFINLLTFKNALAHLPYTRVLLTRDDKRYYELTQLDQARLRIQLWQPERKAGDEN
jgi:hypothetical protein